jgi:hypothetical protein
MKRTVICYMMIISWLGFYKNGFKRPWGLIKSWVCQRTSTAFLRLKGDSSAAS